MRVLVVALALAACSSSHPAGVDAPVIGDDDGPPRDGSLPPLDAPPPADAPCASCTSLVTAWEHHFGGPEFGEYVTSVATDGDGDAYAAGFFTGTIDLGGGYTLTSAAATPPPPQPTSDIVVASYRGDGTIRWAVQVGGTDTDQASGIFVRAGKVYVAASFAGTITVDGTQLTSKGPDSTSDSLVLVLDAATGHAITHYTYGSTGEDYALSVAADAAGNVTVCGDFPMGSLDFGGGHSISGTGTGNAYVVSFTPAGAHRWSRTLAGSAPVAPATSSYSSAQQLAIDGSGNIAIAGEWMGTTDFGAGTVHSSAPQNYDFDAFIASYAPDGTPRWSKSYGGGQSDTANTVATGANGDVVIGGGFHGTVDFGGTSLHQVATYINGYALLLDGASGATRVARSIDDLQSSAVRGVRIDSHGDVVATGEVESASTDFGNGVVLPSAAGGEEDLVVVGYDHATGHTTFGQRWGGAGATTTFADPTSLALTVRDSMVVGGVLSGPVDLGDGPIAGATRDMGYVMLVPR